MTLRQMHAINARHVQALEVEQWPFGVIASTVANFSMGAPKNALKPSDFGLGPKSPEIVPGPESNEKIGRMRAWLQGLPKKPTTVSDD